ncbi:MAG: DUF6142 family protein [Lachnospiraceae bacterium]|nr:DUF6142 family protein [Lachnospiraceae bacterium]
MRKDRIIFKSHEQSDIGIMSLILGIISALSVVYSIVYSYVRQGEINDRFGVALFVTLIMSIVGAVLGTIARKDTDKLQLIPKLAIALNILVIVFLGALLWIGLN